MSPKDDVNTISESIDTLTDGVWDWRDVKASAALLISVGSLVMSGLLALGLV